MEYYKCSEAKNGQIFQAFKQGFSDYSVPISMDEEMFFERFFGMEGNSLDQSFIALDNENPVGLILGGIRTFDGYHNQRVGTLCIAPEYRGLGVSTKLYDQFVQAGIENNCERFSLEVLSHNERAIRFYEKRGFEKQNKLLYFQADVQDVLPQLEVKNDRLQFKPMELSRAKDCRDGLAECHINWQNEPDYFLLDPSARAFGAFDSGELVASLVMTTSGKIYFLWTKPHVRGRSIMRFLITYAIKQLTPPTISLSFPDTLELEGFSQNMGLVKNDVWQYEMVCNLK